MVQIAETIEKLDQEIAKLCANPSAEIKKLQSFFKSFRDQEGK